MSNNSFEIDFDKFDEAISHLGNNTKIIDDSISSSKGALGTLQDKPKACKGINKMVESCDAILNQSNGLVSLFRKKRDRLIEDELYLCKKADEIIVNHDLETVDNIFENNVDSIKLDKKDGKSINSSNQTNEEKINDNYKTTTIKLADFSNNKIAHESSLEDSFKNENVELHKQNNNETKSIEIDDNSIIEKEELFKQNNSNQQELSYDDNIKVNKVDISNINNNETDLHEEEINIDGVEKAKLSSINNNTYINDIPNTDIKVELEKKELEKMDN